MIVVPARRMLAPENEIGLVAGHRQDGGKPETKNKESEQASAKQSWDRKAKRFQRRVRRDAEFAEKCEEQNIIVFLCVLCVSAPSASKEV
jgi:hypothetical protein